MSYYIDMKYINLLGSRLEKFSWKRNNIAVCRCPICGDSKKNKNKTRFFFFEQKGKFFVKCHNCSYSTTFQKFLEQTGGMLYDDYTLENIRDKFQGGTAANYREITKVFAAVEKPTFQLRDELEDCTRIADLPDDHPAKMYIAKRDIARKHWSILYACDDFNVAANRVQSGKYPNDPRIVIPFYNRDRKIFAVQGRSLDPACDLRYITVRDSESDLPKIYGLERLDDRRKNYCFEGPFDSLFVDNGIALAGSSIDMSALPFDTQHTVFVYDNEPRNAEIVKAMNNVANRGYRICVWPSDLQHKDANDMHKAGIDVQQLIDANTYQGLGATLAITKWKKV